MKVLRAILVVQMVTALHASIAATTNEISRFDVTFMLDSNVTYGTFTNGDYWVVGPVTVTNMLPAWDGVKNGWEVNPLVEREHGWDTRVANYSAAKRPAMPFSVTNGSIVKVIGLSSSDDGSYIKTAVVLTVLDEAPPNDGADVFRPPYVGTNKPIYQVSELQTGLLPTYAAVSNAPSLAQVEANFSKCLRMDHMESNSRGFRPRDAMWGYQPNNTPELTEAMLRLMSSGSASEKLPALVMFTQHCLDQAYAILDDYRDPGAGHDPCHRVLGAWAATLLDIAEVKAYMATADGFHEDDYLYTSSVTGEALWGGSNTEDNYWDYVMDGDGNRSNRDPYGYVDGGDPTRAGYQIIVSQPLKGQALVFNLFTNLQTCIPSARYDTLVNYSQRWVERGTFYDPDPVAPYDGTNSNYGVTFGPDGSGGFIAGSGRFLAKDSINADAGQYRSAYVASMWDAYFTPEGAEEGDVTPPEIETATIAEDGTTLTVVFTEVVTQGSGYSDSSLDVDASTTGNDIAVTYSSGDGTNTHVYNLASTIETGETVNLDWDGTVNGLEDAASNDLAAVSNFTVVNNSTNTPTDASAPTLSSATIGQNGRTLTLIFSESVFLGTGYDNSGWNVDGSTAGDDVGMTYSTGSGSATLIYNLLSTVDSEEVVNLDWAGTSDGLEDGAGNDLAAIASASINNASVKRVRADVPPRRLWLSAPSEALSQVEFVAMSSNESIVGTTTGTLTKPAGTAEGDVILAIICTDSDHSIPTYPTGWSEIVHDTGGASGFTIAYKQAGGSEPANYEFTFSAVELGVAALVTYTGTDASSPIYAPASPESGSSPHTTPAVLPPENGCMLVGVVYRDDNSSAVIGEVAGSTLRASLLKAGNAVVGIADIAQTDAVNEGVQMTSTPATTCSEYTIVLRP